MNLEELRERFKTVVGVPDMDTATVDRYINDTLQYTLPLTLYPSELYNEFTTSTVQGTGEYPLPSQMLALLGPVMVENVQVVLVQDRDWFFERFSSRYEVSYGHPQIILVFGNQMWMAPVPDDTYQITAIALARPSPLEDPTDSIFQPSWGPAIQYGAAYSFAIEHGDTELAQTCLQTYNQVVTTIQREQLLRFTGQRATPHF